MADSATTNYGWIKPEIGSSPTTWGAKVNTDLDSIDATVKGVSNSAGAALPLAGGTMTGAITPSSTAGIVGTTAGDNANAGSIGEYLEVIVNTNTPIANGIPVNGASISLPAGDWDVEGMGEIELSSNALYVSMHITTVSLESPDGLPVVFGLSELAANQIFYRAGPTGLKRFNFNVATTVYLVLYAEFTSGTCQGSGAIRARRVR